MENPNRADAQNNASNTETQSRNTPTQRPKIPQPNVNVSGNALWDFCCAQEEAMNAAWQTTALVELLSAYITCLANGDHGLSKTFERGREDLLITCWTATKKANERLSECAANMRNVLREAKGLSPLPYEEGEV